MCRDAQAEDGPQEFDADHVYQEYDPNGDVIFAIGESTEKKTAKFLVSSKALSLASPVFAKLFSPNFSEGIALSKGTCPEIPLPEDDPQAMETILRIIHFLDPQERKPTDSKYIAQVAVHAHKYDCMRAMRAWLTHWVNNDRCRKMDAVEYGNMLLAAYLLRDAPSFRHLSRQAQKEMASDDFEKWVDIEYEDFNVVQPALLPPGIGSFLRQKSETLTDKMFEKLNAVEVTLQEVKGGHVMDGVFCSGCEKTYPFKVTECESCPKATMRRKYCNSNSRVSFYVAELRVNGLRAATPRHLEDFSGSELYDKIRSIERSASKHACGAGSDCLLKTELGKCSSDVWELLFEVEGMPLPDFP